MGVVSNPMDSPLVYDPEDHGLIEEELVTHPERLLAVIQAAEILGLGWMCEREAIELRNEEGKVVEEAIHFRFKTFVETKMVPPNTVAEFGKP